MIKLIFSFLFHIWHKCLNTIYIGHKDSLGVFVFHQKITVRIIVLYLKKNIYFKNTLKTRHTIWRSFSVCSQNLVFPTCKQRITIDRMTNLLKELHFIIQGKYPNGMILMKERRAEIESNQNVIFENKVRCKIFNFRSELNVTYKIHKVLPLHLWFYLYFF